ncbi:RNA methyltransferase [Synechocystis sp. LKSZ1]|uniref:TrmH family RNA methyltransferase n=1 Tax=Synechocystis sp. LKSZ1 TaxID=3144951 RepID=UPI00336BE3CC
MSELTPAITSPQNPLVKQIRQLHRPKGRREQAQFLLEGTHLLETALALECSPIVACYTPAWQARYPQLWQRLTQQAQRAVLVSPDVLALLATTVNPDGVVATLAQSDFEAPPPAVMQLGLVLECLQDPGNLGTILRTAVATEVGGLWLSQDSVDWQNPKVLRASAGACLQLIPQTATNLKTVIQSYQVQGFQIIATLPQATKTYWEIDFRRPSLLLFGNEGQGLSPELVALTDEQVVIPQARAVESLNVAVAVALLLYEAQRQKQFT